MNNREVEIKFFITEETKNKLMFYLNTNAEFFGKTSQKDTYYIPYFKDYEINGSTVECLRIRETESHSVLCYKHIHKETTPVYCDEFETKIDNPSETEKILLAIGFSVQMVIDKTRISYKMNNFEFDFDSVTNLGEFLEIELTSNENEEDLINQIYEFVKPFGLSQNDTTTDGIQTLMKKAKKK